MHDASRQTAFIKFGYYDYGTSFQNSIENVDALWCIFKAWASRSYNNYIPPAAAPAALFWPISSGFINNEIYFQFSISFIKWKILLKFTNISATEILYNNQ